MAMLNNQMVIDVIKMLSRSGHAQRCCSSKTVKKSFGWQSLRNFDLSSQAFIYIYMIYRLNFDSQDPAEIDSDPFCLYLWVFHSSTTQATPKCSHLDQRRDSRVWASCCWPSGESLIFRKTGSIFKLQSKLRGFDVVWRVIQNHGFMMVYVSRQWRTWRSV